MQVHLHPFPRDVWGWLERCSHYICRISTVRNSAHCSHYSECLKQMQDDFESIFLKCGVAQLHGCVPQFQNLSQNEILKVPYDYSMSEASSCYYKGYI